MGDVRSIMDLHALSTLLSLDNIFPLTRVLTDYNQLGILYHLGGVGLRKTRVMLSVQKLFSYLDLFRLCHRKPIDLLSRNMNCYDTSSLSFERHAWWWMMDEGRGYTRHKSWSLLYVDAVAFNTVRPTWNLKQLHEWTSLLVLCSK